MLHVLLLDNNELNGNSLARSLERVGEFPCRVTVVTTAHQAYTTVPQADPPFDVLLIDHPPGDAQDGIAVMHELVAMLKLLREWRETRREREQIGAAFERAQWYEHERHQAATLERKHAELEVLAEIGRRVSNRAASLPLAALLDEVRIVIDPLISADHFFIALHELQNNQIELRLIYVNGEHLPPRILPRRMGLVRVVIDTNQPTLLPTTVSINTLAQQRAVRRKIFRNQRAKSWLGVPLSLDDHAIGAIVVQNTEREHAYDEKDQQLLMAVAGQVAGAIQTARLKEEADRNSSRLALLQLVHEELMKLAEQNEALFWHATLTATTAGYGLGFNRAMLFLAQHGGIWLQGHMGIGEIDGRRARAAWKRDLRHNLTFAQYLAQPAEQRMTSTEVDRAVRQISIDLSSNAGAFGQVIRENHTVYVPRQEAERSLPKPFVDTFGKAEYALLPLLVGNKLLGVVVVDNIHNDESLQRMPFGQLETLLAQAALVYENLRQRRASEQLIEVNHAVLARIAYQELKQVLDQICVSAQAITAADSVLIYPLARDSTMAMPRYATEHAAHVGLRQPFRPRELPGIEGVTAQILLSGETLAFNDVHHQPWYQQKREESFLVREQVRAFIAAPLRDVTNGQMMGVLYLNYHTPQPFGEYDTHRAESFAALAGAAVRASRAEEVVRVERDEATLEAQLRGDELDILRRVQQVALQLDVDLKQIVQVLLEAARDLLRVPNQQVGIVLREWQPSPTDHGQPAEIRRRYYLLPNHQLSEGTPQELYLGLTGHALIMGMDQRAEDVTKEPWSAYYQRRFEGDTTSAELAELVQLNREAPTISELDVLIKLEEQQVFGLFNIESPVRGAFSSAAHRMIRQLADVAALALDNVYRQGNLHRLLEVAEGMIAADDAQSTMQAVLEAVQSSAAGVASATLLYRDSETKQLVSGPSFGVRQRAYLGPQRIMRDPLLNAILKSKQPIWRSQFEQPEATSRYIQDEQIASTAGFPLYTSDSPEVIGVLFLNYRKPHHFTREEKVLFPMLATIAAASIRDALRLEEVRNQQKRLETALRIALTVSTTVSRDEALTGILRALHELLPTAKPAVLLYDRRQRLLTFTAISFQFYRVDPSQRTIQLPVHGGGLEKRSIVGRVALQALQSGNPEFDTCPNVADVEDYYAAFPNTRSQLTLALVSAELHLPHEQRLLGVLVLESEQIDAFDAESEALIRGIGPSVSLAIERARQNAEKRYNNAVATATVWIHEMAHDINSEIGNIRDQAYLLSPMVSAPDRAYVTRIVEGAERMASYARAPRASEAEQFVIDAWLREKVTEIVRVRGSRVLPHFELTCATQLVAAAPILLERALRHLIRNAHEAMDEEGILLVRTGMQNGMVEVQVANSGPDIPAATREMLFVEQTSTKGAERMGEEGGLGLLFARWAIEAIGGTIWLESVPGEMVTFAFTLPIAP